MAAPGSVVAGVKVPDGDPGALRGIAGKFSGSAQAVGRVKGQLASAQGQVGSWTGRAAEGFYSTCETNEGAAGAMVGAFHAAARAVSRYAHELEAAQHEAAHLQRQAQAAETTMHIAQAAIARAVGAGHHLPATASADLSTAQGDLTTIHGRAAALLRHVEAAGRTAAGEVHAATGTIPRWTAPPPPPAPPEPEHHSFFSLHTVESAGSSIADGAKDFAGGAANATGGFAHGFSFGLVGWGDEDSTAYKAGDVASYIPVTPAAVGKDAGKLALRIGARELEHGTELEAGRLAEDGRAVVPRPSRGWRPGDDVWSPTAAGNAPAWSTVRARYWKNVARDPATAAEWNDRNLARMRVGMPPQRFNPDKGGMESMELSHEPTPRRNGGRDLVQRWPQDHAAVDRYRHPGY